MQAENNKNNIIVVVFGCRLNSLEAAKIQTMLAPVVDNAVLVNTCAVTAEAERQSAQQIRKIARDNPNAPIFVTGCAASRNPDLFRAIPNALVIPNDVKMRLDSYLDAMRNAQIPFSTTEIRAVRPAPNLSKQFIQIQNGCNHKCTYCVTRLLRGPAVSFEYDAILLDARTAVQNGFSEIVLTGIDIASFARDGMLVSDLCARLLADVPEIRRLRLSSMDPASPEIFKIIDMIARDPRMMPHLHLSMQSGSDAILCAMGRRHNAELVRRIAEYGAAVGVTFSWDIICGFPGESDEYWAQTTALARAVRPIKVHAFPFSPRPDTIAATMPNQIPRNVSKQRVKEITAIADAARAEFMRQNIGQSVQVLIQENNTARTPHDIDVILDGNAAGTRCVATAQLVDIRDGAFIGRIK